MEFAEVDIAIDHKIGTFYVGALESLAVKFILFFVLLTPDMAAEQTPSTEVSCVIRWNHSRFSGPRLESHVVHF